MRPKSRKIKKDTNKNWERTTKFTCNNVAENEEIGWEAADKNTNRVEVRRRATDGDEKKSWGTWENRPEITNQIFY